MQVFVYQGARNNNKTFQGIIFNNLDDAAKLYTALYMDSRELKDRRGHCGLLREEDKVTMYTKAENIQYCFSPLHPYSDSYSDSSQKPENMVSTSCCCHAVFP